MKKKTAQRISEITETLGVKDYSYYNAPIQLSGEDAMLSGYGKYPRDSEFDKNETYEFESPVIVANTWEKELKRAYQQNGEQGIYEVVKKEYINRGLHLTNNS